MFSKINLLCKKNTPKFVLLFKKIFLNISSFRNGFPSTKQRKLSYLKLWVPFKNYKTRSGSYSHLGLSILKRTKISLDCPFNMPLPAVTMIDLSQMSYNSIVPKYRWSHSTIRLISISRRITSSLFLGPTATTASPLSQFLTDLLLRLFHDKLNSTVSLSHRFLPIVSVFNSKFDDVSLWKLHCLLPLNADIYFHGVFELEVKFACLEIEENTKTSVLDPDPHSECGSGSSC
jgi:hypothetical protein